MKKPNFRREIRLGLVVYGGVALAIYMNGVCREFYNAVRGRGIYKLVKALTDADIVVDIISGTSAGGINGVLLSYALTNSSVSEVVDFVNFSQIWRESGDIFKLMREPSSNNTKVESVLNGEGYYQNKLEEAFEQGYINKTNAPKNEWVSDFNELDLFITGTDVFGKIFQVFDDTGSVIEIKDHRAVFQLKHRRGRKEPFNPKRNYSPNQITASKTYQSLAKLCRITSCFPVAFPIVEVELKGDNKIDQLLVEWGQLEKQELDEHPKNETYKLYFIDGGVLDNRPFSYTIKEMYYRTSNRPVERKLFYIDPSPDRFIGSDKKISKPNTLQVIQDSLVGIPTYESIGNDLELIKAHNEKVRRYRTLLADADTPSNSVISTSDVIDIEETIYLRSRLINLRDRVVPLVLRMEQEFRVAPQKQAYLEKAANILTEQVTGEKDKEKRDKIRQAFGEQIRNLDVEYSFRKHFYLLHLLCQQMEKEANLEEYNKFRYLSENISRQIKLIEVIREALNQLLTNSLISESFYELLAQIKQDYQIQGQFYERLLRLHRFLLDTVGLEQFIPENNPDLEAIPANIFQSLPVIAREEFYSEWLSQKRISSILLQFTQKINKLVNPQILEETIWKNPAFNYDKQENEVFETILRKVELSSEALIETSDLNKRDEILRRFQDFRNLDKVLYPFEYLTNLHEKELIQTIRISPSDANLGLGEGRSLEDKLAGDTLYAFGGFFKKSWRSNDILWGRLDGLNRLIEALLTPESVKNFSDFLSRQCPYRKGTPEFKAFTEQYLELLLNESLPIDESFSDEQKNTSKENCQIILECLSKFANETLQEDELKLTLDRLVSILVLEGHRAIVNTDLSNVLQDEIAEQLNWNQQRIQPKKPTRPKGNDSNSFEDETPKYQPVPGYFERRVSALAAARLAEEAILKISQGNTETFFRRQYNVGQETILDSIPRPILATISTQFALILRNIILTTLGKRSSILRKSITFNILDKSLQLFYGWLQFTGPLAVQTSRYRPIFLIIQLILLVLAISGIAIIVWQSWIWLVVVVSAILLFWLLELIRRISSNGN